MNCYGYMRVAATIVGILCIAACQPTTTGAANGTSATPAVVATVNGETIPGAELDKAIAGHVKQMEARIAQLKENMLDQLIEEKLIESAAKQAGKTSEAYLKEEVDDKVTQPTEEELKKFYEQRKAQIGDRKFDDVKGQIKQVLTQSRTQALRQTLLERLRATADIKIHLEQHRVAIEGGDNPARGPKGAKVEIIEWTDYQCPYCAQARPVLNQVLTTYGDKVRYVLRDFPLDFHANAFKAHEAAHCAGDQGKYWEMNQLLFENGHALQEEKLKEYAGRVKLDATKFGECLGSEKYKKKIEGNIDAGVAAGVSGTPSFFVNGIPMTKGRGFNDFKEMIDRELAKK